MRAIWIDRLRCPVTKKPFILHALETTQEGEGEEKVRIRTGVLITEDKLAYPIVNSIPRLLEGAMSGYEEDLIKYKAELDKLEIDPKSYIIPEFFKEFFARTQAQFQHEWDHHDVDKLTWGMDQEFRVARYCTYMGLDRNLKYTKKLFMDVGAGTGQLTSSLSEALDCEIIGLDLTQGIEAGEQIRRTLKNSHKVLYVQGNMLAMPFVEELCDCVHASGVLHHAPSTKEAFKSVQKHVKKGGKMGAWLYNQGQDDMHLIPGFNVLRVKTLRKFMRTWPPLLVHWITRIIMSFAWVLQMIINLIKGRKAMATNFNDAVSLVYDAIIHYYAHIHTPEEVIGWFKEYGYEGMFETDQENNNGFNITGIRK